MARGVPSLYELEVKRYLIQHRFLPARGWKVTVHVDPMEEGGPNQPPDKKERTARAKTWLERNGVGLGDHPDFPRADIVAARHGRPSYVIEVKGEARVQKGVAIQQALGQIQQQMRPDRDARYVIATPNTPDWEDQMERIPAHVCDQLSLRLWLVDETGVQEI